MLSEPLERGSVDLRETVERSAQPHRAIHTGVEATRLRMGGDAAPRPPGKDRDPEIKEQAFENLNMVGHRPALNAALGGDIGNIQDSRMRKTDRFQEALCRDQWEMTNRAWSPRGRPDILAMLYQLGFARSKPQAAARSNAFGRRVHDVYMQPWLGELLERGDRLPL
jgi:hypothetical protein